MGYCMSQMDSSFRVDQHNIMPMVASLKELARTSPRLSWVDPKVLLEAATLEEISEELRWFFHVDVNGNIDDIQFEGEKLGAEEKIFNAMAPYVRSGSFIEIHGEDGTTWRWVFKNGVCKEVQPQKIWGDDDDGDFIEGEVIREQRLLK